VRILDANASAFILRHGPWVNAFNRRVGSARRRRPWRGVGHRAAIAARGADDDQGDLCPERPLTAKVSARGQNANYLILRQYTAAVKPMATFVNRGSRTMPGLRRSRTKNAGPPPGARRSAPLNTHRTKAGREGGQLTP